MYNTKRDNRIAFAQATINNCQPAPKKIMLTAIAVNQPAGPALLPPQWRPIIKYSTTKSGEAASMTLIIVGSVGENMVRSIS